MDKEKSFDKQKSFEKDRCPLCDEQLREDTTEFIQDGESWSYRGYCENHGTVWYNGYLLVESFGQESEEL